MSGSAKAKVRSRRVEVTPRQFRFVAAFSATLLVLIIVTGAAVRLSGSGLGCPQWPNCAEGQLAPTAANGRAGMIEFGNRVVTGLCLLAAVVGLMTAYRRRPFRKDLVTMGWIVGGLLFANALVGGAVVIFDLKSVVVIAHFVLAIVTLTAGLVVFHRAGEDGPSDVFGRARVPVVDERIIWTARIVSGLLLLGLVLGTVVTGSGPHSGDPAKTERLPFGVEAASRVHSTMMWLVLVAVVILAARVQRAGYLKVRTRVTWLLAALVAQGGIGYLQYAKQLPAGLVGVHVFGSTIVWTLLVWVRASLTTTRSEPDR